MPGNLQSAVPSGVMPYSLCTAFSESREYVQLQAQYHYGTTERSHLAPSSHRTSNLANRLTATAAALKTFWDGQQGGLVPLLFYNLVEGTYDPTGNSTQGRYSAVSGATGLASGSHQFTECPQNGLVEVPEMPK